MELQVGVKVFLKNKNGEFLLLKRNTEKYKNIKDFWDIPGGRIIPGTFLIENLKRELKEETELDLVGVPDLIFAQDILKNNEKHIVRLSYIGEAEGDLVLDMDENVEFKWISIEGMKKQENLCVFIKEILDKGVIV
jgi:ADP-ribose pyrophosphatase YjhB (NUDIX family)